MPTVQEVGAGTAEFGSITKQLLSLCAGTYNMGKKNKITSSEVN